MLESIMILLAACFFGRMTPGPDMLLIMRHAMAVPQGERPLAAYACVAGICLGLMVHVSLSVMGLALVIQNYPAVFRGIQIAGALYLLYVAYRCFQGVRGGSSLFATADMMRKQVSVKQGFFDGLFCNLLNPKVTLFILSVFTQIVSVDSTQWQKAVYGGIIVVEAFFGWLLFVCMLNTSFIRRLYGGRQGAMNLITGILFAVLGVAMLLAG
ncbi:LysE family translocator [Oleidesulfovibrio sp.]|uniref:LysE family translocator n=1 Tax=Oleidesulfovibrio sp. TaxID=2909707 RepID=UPI003A85549A